MRTRYVNLTSSGSIAGGDCVLESMYVNSTSSGAFKLFHRAAAGYGDQADSKAIFGTITPAAGFHNLMSLHATAGLYMWVTAGTINVTFAVRENDV